MLCYYSFRFFIWVWFFIVFMVTNKYDIKYECPQLQLGGAERADHHRAQLLVSPWPSPVDSACVVCLFTNLTPASPTLKSFNTGNHPLAGGLSPAASISRNLTPAQLPTRYRPCLHMNNRLLHSTRLVEYFLYFAKVFSPSRAIEIRTTRTHYFNNTTLYDCPTTIHAGPPIDVHCGSLEAYAVRCGFIDCIAFGVLNPSVLCWPLQFRRGHVHTTDDVITCGYKHLARLRCNDAPNFRLVWAMLGDGLT